MKISGVNMKSVENIKKELLKFSNVTKKEKYYRYFQAFPGGYGEGDEFYGVTVPEQRKLAKKFYNEISLEETFLLLENPVHECRLTSVFILVLKFQKTKDENLKQKIFNGYLQRTDFINNWDIVDSSAEHIVGAYLDDKSKDLIIAMAESGDLWKQRISVLSCFYSIKKNSLELIEQVASILLNHEHDLIHKAVGWMLREGGKRDYQWEYNFLQKNYKNMPRVMLRYAIEKFEEPVRKKFLKGEV